MRQVFLHRRLAFGFKRRIAVVRKEHILHAVKLVGRDEFLREQVVDSRALGQLGGAVYVFASQNFDFIAVYMRQHREGNADIARLIRFVKGLVHLRDRRLAFGIDRVDVMEHLPFLAVDRAVDQQSGRQLDVGTVLTEEGRADGGDRAHTAEIKIKIAALAVGETEKRTVRIRRARSILPVGKSGIAFGRIVKSGRMLLLQRPYKLDLHRLAGNEVDRIVVIAFRGIPVQRLVALLQFQLAIIVLNGLGLFARVLAFVFINADLVDKQPCGRHAGKRNAHVPRMDRAGKRHRAIIFDRICQALRRQHIADDGIIFSVIRNGKRHAGRKPDGIIHHAQQSNVNFRNIVRDRAEVQINRNRRRAGKADKIRFAEAVICRAVGQLLAVGVQIRIRRVTRERIGTAGGQIDLIQRAVDLAGIERIDGRDGVRIHKHLLRFLARRRRLRRSGRAGSAVVRVAARSKSKRQRERRRKQKHERLTCPFHKQLLLL